MKILHINKFFDLHGGAEIAVHNVMKRQRDLGHEVHIFSTSSPKNEFSEDAAYFVERFDYATQEGARKDLRKAASYIWNREAQHAVERMLEVIQPDVIHLHNLYHHLSTSVLEPIRRSKIPCVQTLHDYKLACPNYKMFTEGSVCERCRGGRYTEAITHHCLSSSSIANVLAAFEMGMTKFQQSYERTVQTFLCPSQFMVDKMAAWGEPPGKLVYHPNAVELSSRPATRDGGYVFAAGRLSPEKGFDVLIRAAARIPTLTVKIAGIGPEESRLRMLATSLSATNVQFLGFLRRSEHAEVWSRAIAHAMPSLNYENAPLSILDAMADGLPILGSRIGGIPEMVVDQGNGFLVEAGNVDAWADALATFSALSEPERTRMAEESRRLVVEKFSWERHLKQLFALYRQAGAVG